MTPYEIRDLSVLPERRGASVQAWQYTCTHARLFIRIYWPTERQASNLLLLFVGCSAVHFKTHWVLGTLDVEERVSPLDSRIVARHGEDLYVDCGSLHIYESSDFMHLD